MAVTTTATLTLGAVTLGSPFPGAVPDAGEAVVGAAPWSDGSDATYAHLIEAGTAAQDGRAWTQATPLDAELISYTVRVRAKSVPGTGSDPAVLAVFFGRLTAGHGTFGDLLDIPSDGAIHDVSVDGFGFGTNPLPDGASVEVAINSPGNDVTVYEVEIVVTIPATEIRVTRQFPRDDAYGLGSAPRIFPPPRGGRLVGGYQ